MGDQDKIRRGRIAVVEERSLGGDAVEDSWSIKLHLTGHHHPPPLTPPC